MSPKEVLEFAKKNDAKQLDLRFTDIPGLQHHVSYPIGELDESSFEEGFGMDGSSIRGWAAIHESDMLLIPDPNTAIMDPFAETPTLVMIGDVKDPVTKQRYERDPRWIGQKAELYLKNSGIADTAYFGAEAEFFIFDNVSFDQNQHAGFYFIDAEEGRWNSGRRENNLGYRPRYKEGYFPVPPTDHYQDLRSEMVQTMIKCGMHIECHHHEVATGGQAEIDQRFDKLVKSADNMMLYKYIIRNVANQYGKTVTFMPKPLFADNGSGMHTHQSLWKGGKPLFAGDGYAGFSQMGLYYIGGLLKHARALSAIIAPTTNSYKRLVPGYEAPVNLAYSRRNRSAACRIPMYSANPKAKRVEFRPPDTAANPYLAFAAMLMAGLDGVLNKIDPGEPLDKDIYDLSPEEMKSVPSMPGSLEEALSCLEDDHAFLLRGDVFTRRTDRDLHRLQAQERSGCRASAAAPVRVRAVLRHLGEADTGQACPAPTWQGRGMPSPASGFDTCKASSSKSVSPLGASRNAPFREASSLLWASRATVMPIPASTAVRAKPSCWLPPKWSTSSSRAGILCSTARWARTSPRAALTIRDIRIGDRLRAGGATLEITEPRGPCSALDVYGESLKDEIYDDRVRALDHTSPRWGMSGFYASVVAPGPVRPDDIIAVVAKLA